MDPAGLLEAFDPLFLPRGSTSVRGGLQDDEFVVDVKKMSLIGRVVLPELELLSANLWLLSCKGDRRVMDERDTCCKL